MVVRCRVWVVATMHSQTEWTEPPRARSQRAQPHTSATSPHTSWLWQMTCALSLSRYCTTFDNSVHESLSLINFVSRFLQSGAPLLLVLHVLSAVNGHLMHCPTLQDSLGHTRHRLLLRRLDHRCFLCDSLRRLWLHSDRRN